MEKIVNITKNTSYLTFALVLQKIISFTYFTLLARNLGPESLGKYYFAISFATIFSIFIDIGLVNVLTREVAKKQDQVKNLLGSVLAIKLPLSILVVVLAVVVVNLMQMTPLLNTLVYISLACVILDSFTTTFWAISRGFHNLFFESISSVLFQAIVMFFGLLFLYQGLGLVYISLALLLASCFHFIYSFVILQSKFRIPIRFVFDKDLIKKILAVTVPFAVFVIFQRLYINLDSVLLKFLAGDEHVGYYQVSFKIIFALQFLPMAFVASLYPAMSKYWLSNKPQLKITFEKSIIYLMIISLPISAGVLVLADQIVLIFKQDFLAAILPMQVIILSVLFMFINFPIGALLNACDKQGKNTKNMIIATILSVVLNIILIPKYQSLGASISVLVTNILMSILGFYYVVNIIKVNYQKLIFVFAKVAAAAGLMGWLVFYLKDSINIIALILAGGLAYLVLLFVFKTVQIQEVKYIYSNFLKK